MPDFKDLGIELEEKGFDGDKIEMFNILNEKITVMDYKIGESKYQKKGGERCLHMQFIFEGKKRVVFNGSEKMMEVLEKVPKGRFPFDTIIKKVNKRYVFCSAETK